MVLLNQAREKISKLQHELDAAHKTIKDLQDKMNDRNAKIAQMAKGQIVQLTHHVTKRPPPGYFTTSTFLISQLKDIIGATLTFFQIGHICIRTLLPHLCEVTYLSF